MKMQLKLKVMIKNLMRLKSKRKKRNHKLHRLRPTLSKSFIVHVSNDLSLINFSVFDPS
jgi:hypothetical protein